MAGYSPERKKFMWEQREEFKRRQKEALEEVERQMAYIRIDFEEGLLNQCNRLFDGSSNVIGSGREELPLEIRARLDYFKAGADRALNPGDSDG